MCVCANGLGRYYSKTIKYEIGKRGDVYLKMYTGFMARKKIGEVDTGTFKCWAILKEILGKLDEILDEIFVKYINNLQRITTIPLEPRMRQVEIIYIVGEPGFGKSKMAMEITEAPYWQLFINKWCDGYNGQKHGIIDDQHDHIALTHLKRWLDIYPLLSEVIGERGPAQYEKLLEPSMRDVQCIYIWWETTVGKSKMATELTT
ncbi:hypothetical protein HZS_2533 [Henneguya salminicola]|nr:hypothetical protein HZS_2533 [Henneguya salminicola]